MQPGPKLPDKQGRQPDPCVWTARRPSVPAAREAGSSVTGAQSQAMSPIAVQERSAGGLSTSARA